MTRQWMVVLAGPLVWFLHLLTNFALAPWACSLQWKPALYVVSAVCLAITAGSALLAWNDWQQRGRDFPGEAGGASATSRVLASGGVLLNAGFFLVILVQTITEIVLGACS